MLDRVTAGTISDVDGRIIWSKAYVGRSAAQVRGFAKAAIRSLAWNLTDERHFTIRTFVWDLMIESPDHIEEVEVVAKKGARYRISVVPANSTGS